MTTDVITVDEKTIDAIEAACKQCSLTTLAGISTMKRTMVLAKGMQTLRKHMTGEMMKDIAGLANTKIGFKTDAQSRGRDYSHEEMRDVIIEAMLRGASVIGNEFNIIAGGCYLTKEYFERVLREHPDVSNLRVQEGIPVMSKTGDYAFVPMQATWELNGTKDELKCEGDYRIAVRVNKGATIDQLLGKAKRKLLARIYARVTGSAWIADQADMEPAIDVDSVAAPVVSLEAPQTPEPEEIDETARELFRGIEATLAGLENLSDVNGYELSAAAVLTTDEDRMTLKEWCDNRREQIRESRGQRANGKA